MLPRIGMDYAMRREGCLDGEREQRMEQVMSSEKSVRCKMSGMEGAPWCLQGKEQQQKITKKQGFVIDGFWKQYQRPKGECVG